MRWNEKVDPISHALAGSLKGKTSEDLRIGPCPDSWALAKLALGEADQATRQQLNLHVPFCESCMNDYLAVLDREELQDLAKTHERPSLIDGYNCKLGGNKVQVSVWVHSYDGTGELNVSTDNEHKPVSASLYMVDEEHGRETLLCGGLTNLFGEMGTIVFNARLADIYRCELKAAGKQTSVYIDLEQGGLGWRDVRSVELLSNEYQIRTLIGNKLFCSIVPMSSTSLPVIGIRVEKEEGDVIREFTTLGDGSLDFEIDNLPKARSYLFYIHRGSVTKRIAYVVHHGTVEGWANAQQLEAEIVKKVSGA